MAELLRHLDEARARTHRLIAPIAADDYKQIHHPAMGPVAWDVGHIGQQEDLWLVQRLGGHDETLPGSNDTYDAYRHPRPSRVDLPLLDADEVQTYHQAVRERALDVLNAPLDPEDPLVQGWYVLHMVLLHEHQHNETILQHLAAYPTGRYTPPMQAPEPSAPRPVPSDFVPIPGGTMVMGVPPRTPGTYDNEWPPRTVEVAPFWIQRTPVSNRDYRRFVDSGGYSDPSLWHPDGWRLMVEEEGAEAPLYWVRSDDGWRLRAFDRVVPLPLDHPVSNVSWYEADAYARWAGARLPTEAEWEHVATMDPETGAKRRHPWGDPAPAPRHANLDQVRFGTDPIGSHPDGASPHGVHQLIGDVWEWTASVFSAYPGYEAFPYREYSETFFDQDLMVLRGGSWATRPLLNLGTFRNWDLPQRRQIFAGIRLARDAPPGGGPGA